ncbi:MAG: histidine kinase N-terminal 7TM domain-containing protein, partial [Paracoccaceae bacterium]
MPDFSVPAFDLTDPALIFTLINLAGMSTLFVIVWRRSIFTGKRYFLLTLLACVWWLIVTAMELSATDMAGKIFWSKLAWTAVTTLSISWTLFLFDYCFDRQLIRDWPRYALIGGTLVMILVGSQTNDIHGAFYGPDTRLVITDGKPYVVYDHGPLLYVFAAILYLWFVGAVAIALFAAVRAARIYRAIFRVLLAVAVIPVSGN